MKSTRSTALLLVILLAWESLIFPAVAIGTKIKTPDGLVSVEQLHAGDSVSTSANESARIISITPKKVRTVYDVVTQDKVCTVSAHQKLYDSRTKAWVLAKDVTDAHALITVEENVLDHLVVHMRTDETIVYEITLDSPHTFFIGDAQILAHNFIGIGISIAFGIGEGIALTGISLVGFSSLVIAGFYRMFGRDSRESHIIISKEELEYNYYQKHGQHKKPKSDKSNKGSNGNKSPWDYTHNEVEAYCSGKDHMGAIDPLTKMIYKAAVIGRTLGF